jgi:hypothetical protein
VKGEILLFTRGQHVARIGRLEQPVTCISLSSALLLGSTYSTCLVLQQQPYPQVQKFVAVVG